VAREREAGPADIGSVKHEFSCAFLVSLFERDREPREHVLQGDKPGSSSIFDMVKRV